MPVRAVVLFNIGPVFGGFRAALRPGVFGLDNPDAFRELERAVDEAYAFLEAHEPAAWSEFADLEHGRTVPRFGGREGRIDVTAHPGSASEEDLEVVARGWLPFRGWPLGGWVVFEGRRRAADGTWTPFNEDELAKLW